MVHGHYKPRTSKEDGVFYFTWEQRPVSDQLSAHRP